MGNQSRYSWREPRVECRHPLIFKPIPDENQRRVRRPIVRRVEAGNIVTRECCNTLCGARRRCSVGVLAEEELRPDARGDGGQCVGGLREMSSVELQIDEAHKRRNERTKNGLLGVREDVFRQAESFVFCSLRPSFVCSSTLLCPAEIKGSPCRNSMMRAHQKLRA